MPNLNREIVMMKTNRRSEPESRARLPLDHSLFQRLYSPTPPFLLPIPEKKWRQRIEPAVF